MTEQRRNKFHYEERIFHLQKVWMQLHDLLSNWDTAQCLLIISVLFKWEDQYLLNDVVHTCYVSVLSLDGKMRQGMWSNLLPIHLDPTIKIKVPTSPHPLIRLFISRHLIHTQGNWVVTIFANCLNSEESLTSAKCGAIKSFLSSETNQIEYTVSKQQAIMVLHDIELWPM